MRVLVIGGAASGKSAYAERLACKLSPTRVYLATMDSHGTEAQRRIAQHRAQRAGLGFVTVECAGPSLAAVVGMGANGAPRPGVVLLEDLGNLVASALFGPNGEEGDPRRTVARLEREVLALAHGFEHVVAVGNEVGCEGASPFEGTREWVRAMGALGCRLAARFDAVVEVSSGVACVLKGELP